MSQAIAEPKMGSIAAFKQRHEAYQMVHALKADVQDAKWALSYDDPTGAMHVARLAEKVERHPVAADMVAKQPALAAEVQSLAALGRNELADDARRETARENEPKTISRGEWRHSHGTETRVAIGKSEQGYHYMLSVTRNNWENDPQWSKALPSERHAREAGAAAEDRAHGFDRKQTPLTARGHHAERLEAAGNARQRASCTNSLEWRAQAMKEAREYLSEARSTREQSMERTRQPERRPSMGMSR